jgi:hypothetical protein
MGATTTVHAAIFAEATSVPQLAQDITDDLTSQGLTVVDYGVGSTDSVFPAHIAAHWVMNQADGKDVVQAVKDTAARHGTFLGAWTDFGADIGTQVIEPTLQDLTDDVKSVGLGLGLTAALLVVGLGVVLVMMARAGAFKSIRLGAV